MVFHDEEHGGPLAVNLSDARGECASMVQIEVYGDRGVNVGGFAIEEVGLVGPLADGIDGGECEVGIGRRDRAKRTNVAVAADDGVEDDSAPDSGLEIAGRINWLDLGDDLAGHQATGDSRCVDAGGRLLHGVVGGELGSRWSKRLERRYLGFSDAVFHALDEDDASGDIPALKWKDVVAKCSEHSEVEAGAEHGRVEVHTVGGKQAEGDGALGDFAFRQHDAVQLHLTEVLFLVLRTGAVNVVVSRAGTEHLVEDAVGERGDCGATVAHVMLVAAVEHGPFGVTEGEDGAVAAGRVPALDSAVDRVVATAVVERDVELEMPWRKAGSIKLGPRGSGEEAILWLLCRERAHRSEKSECDESKVA